MFIGIGMTKSGLMNILKKHGIVEYIPLKEKFDPNKHEAVFDYEDEELAPGIVGQVLQSGFKIGDRVLRPAKVGVIKKK
jgi:molecular chaperone GrpE